MKPIAGPFKGIILVLCLFAFLGIAQNAVGQNTLQGFVFDKVGSPLADIDVELLDDYYRLVPNGRQKTDSSGHFQFAGLSNGRFTLRVLAFRYDLVDQERPVELNSQNIRGGVGSGFYNEDFFLSPKRGGLRDAELGVVFAQDIPREAKKAFDDGIELLSKKKVEEGLTEINRAIDIFPTYFAALNKMGQEMAIRKRYKEAMAMLIRAINVNPKSANSLFYLAMTFYEMGPEYFKAAETAISETQKLAPASGQVAFQAGKIARALGKFNDAEKFLLQAKKLSNQSVPEIHKELSQLYANDLLKYKEAADELEAYLKASKASDDEEKSVKKIIANLREKAKNPPAS